jgi:hypothetical protein
MTLPIAPTALPNTPVDATRAAPPPPPNEVKRLQAMIQEALKNGYSREEVSAQLQADRGITLEKFERMTRVTLRNLLRSGAMGSTLGFADELIGAMEKASGRQPSYRDARDAVRQPYELFRAAQPAANFAAEAAGGLLGPGLGVGGTVSRAPGLLRAAGQGALAGGLTGAAAGAGYADEMTDVPGGMLKGTLFGSVLGAGVGAGSEGLLRMARGGAGARLTSAIDAGGGEDALRRAAGEATAAGRGRVNPVGSLTPYLRGEAEFAATRSPAVFGKYGPPTARARAGDAERLIRDVSDITGAPAVGREGLTAARAAEFGPVYDAIAQTATPIGAEHTARFLDIVKRPYVGSAYQEAVAEGVLAGGQATQPGFAALNNLRQHLRGAQEKAFTANDGARGAAFRQAANDLESLLEDAVPEFRAVQSAYRDASRPVNIIDLARLETARQGRSAPMLDHASRDLRRDLLREFGSAKQYRDFMRRVAKEGELAQFMAQVFGNSATARRTLSAGGVQPEDVVGAATRPASLLSRVAERAVPRAVHERAARQMAPLLFAPSSSIDDVIRQLRNLSRRQSAGPLTRGAIPSTMGLLSGSYGP